MEKGHQPAFLPKLLQTSQVHETLSVSFTSLQRLGRIGSWAGARGFPQTLLFPLPNLFFSQKQILIFFCIKHVTYHPCHMRRIKDMNIFHAFLRGVVEEHSTGRSSLPKGWIMEVDVKKWMEVDVKRTASLASCTTKVFTNYLCIFSILFSSQQARKLQDAQAES